MHKHKEVLERAEKASGASKMAKITGSAKNYEHDGIKADRLCRGGFCNGGKAEKSPYDKDFK